MAEPTFDPAQLDALRQCYVEAAFRRLLAEQRDFSANSLMELENRSGGLWSGPALLNTSSLGAPSVPSVPSAGGVGPCTHDVMPEIGGTNGR